MEEWGQERCRATEVRLDRKSCQHSYVQDSAVETIPPPSFNACATHKHNDSEAHDKVSKIRSQQSGAVKM